MTARDRALLRSLLGASLALLGCRGERRPDEGAKPVAEQAQVPVEVKAALEVGVSGCVGLIEDRRGHVCLTRKRKPLHLWLDGARDPQVELRFSGGPIETKRSIDVDGVLVSVELPEVQGRLELETEEGVWALELVPVSAAYQAVREAALASWRTGDSATAHALLEKPTTELDAGEAALLDCLAAQIAMGAADHEQVLAIAERVSSSATVSCVGKAALLAAYVQLHSHPDFNAAEQSLRTAERVGGFDLDTRIGAMYLRGVLELWLGHLDESLAVFEDSARLAQLVGDDSQYASALVMQADALARLGRFEEAKALTNEVEQRAAKLDPERKFARLALELRASAAWVAVLRREDEPGLADPSADLRTLIEAHARLGDDSNVANRRLELAVASVQNADLDQAEAELSALEVGALDPDLLVWFELTAARVALLRGRLNQAEAHLVRAQMLADLNQDRELQWRIAITRGELEHRRGRDEAAIEQFRRASRVADELALSVAGSAGRSRVVTIHSRSDVALVEMLLGRDQTEAAMCTVMAARARHLRGLWAQMRPSLRGEPQRRYRDLLSRHRERKQVIAARLERSWELSTAELELLREQLRTEDEQADDLLAEATALLEHGAPTWTCVRALPQRNGDAVLTMIPGADASRWTFFLAHRESDGDLPIDLAQVNIDDLGSAEAAATAAIERFATILEHTQRLRIIPIGAFVAVDFHQVWLARGRVEPTITYSLGLGEVADLTDPGRARAAVVAGSTNLAAVGREAAAVTEHLHKLDWAVEPRWAPNATAQPTLLHYAGHGYDDGLFGWQSAIELPEIGRVSAAQIVAGQRSPELVVLGACGAGRVAADSIDGGMNLAAAFLLAGARLVIAPVRKVDDAVALELGRGLYRNFPTNGIADPDALARALTLLQSEELARYPTPTGAQSFASWRAWTP